MPAKQLAPLPEGSKNVAAAITTTFSVSVPPPLPSISLTNTFMAFPLVTSGSPREIVPKPWCQGPPGPCWSSMYKGHGELGEGVLVKTDTQGPRTWRFPSFTNTAFVLSTVVSPRAMPSSLPHPQKIQQESWIT